MRIEKKNIFILKKALKSVYKGRGGGVFNIKKRIASEHSTKLYNELKNCFYETQRIKNVDLTYSQEGFYAEFVSAEGYDLKVDSLENIANGILLLNVKRIGNEMHSTVFIPNNKIDYFLKRIKEYGIKLTKKNNPKNERLIGNIESIKNVDFDSFWVGNDNEKPKDSFVWSEVWLKYPFNSTDINKALVVEENFKNVCKNLNIRLGKDIIKFPEYIVNKVYINNESIKRMLVSCDYIAEIRPVHEPTSFFTGLKTQEKKEVIEELLKRTEYNDKNIVVCLLDTGLNKGHPLLTSAIKEKGVQVIDPTWEISDSNGHGTAMAGIILFNDLNEAITNNEKIIISSKIQSVKILDEKHKNNDELYGYITKNAVSISEIENPMSKQIICMAISTESCNGIPTSWSSAIDSIVSGAEEEKVKRLFILSGGNNNIFEFANIPFPEANKNYSIEEPGQSWNAITIGAYTKEDVINSDKTDLKPIAKYGDMSPYNSTSVLWKNKLPIKPEVLFDGGNVATNGSDYRDDIDDLELLTTSNKLFQEVFTTINGTSSAAAQASWFCTQLISEYPNIWPETVRALMIHSARWTSNMKAMFCINDKKTEGIRQLIRTCGYGIPNLSAAIQCKNNHVNMIIEDEIQPYNKKSFNEMNFYELPWPKDILEDLGEKKVILRVTLSYYIEPGPSSIGCSNKYQYQSCGLKFDVNGFNEDKNDFINRINNSIEEKTKKIEIEDNTYSKRWFLGSNNRDVGSIHSDFIEASAIDLSNSRYIAVYPVTGWWKTRKNLDKFNNKVRYSLIVSLETPEKDVDFYTPIMTEIESTISV